MKIVKTKSKVVKPTLLHVSNHLIDPGDVSSITKVRAKAEDEMGRKHSLYIVRLKSNPNPEYPLWIRGEEAIGKLLEHFNIEE